MSFQLVGAWEGGREDSARRCIMLFTETHYCLIGANHDRELVKDAQLTEAEQAEAYRTMFAGGGTYTLSGKTLTLNDEYSRIPRNPKPYRFTEFNIEGNELSFLSPHGTRYVLRKVS